jgi:hypothetical protein
VVEVGNVRLDAKLREPELRRVGDDDPAPIGKREGEDIRSPRCCASGTNVLGTSAEEAAVPCAGSETSSARSVTSACDSPPQVGGSRRRSVRAISVLFTPNRYENRLLRGPSGAHGGTYLRASPNHGFTCRRRSRLK